MIILEIREIIILTREMCDREKKNTTPIPFLFAFKSG